MSEIVVSASDWVMVCDKALYWLSMSCSLGIVEPLGEGSPLLALIKSCTAFKAVVATLSMCWSDTSYWDVVICPSVQLLTYASLSFLVCVRSRMVSLSGLSARSTAFFPVDSSLLSLVVRRDVFIITLFWVINDEYVESGCMCSPVCQRLNV